MKPLSMKVGGLVGYSSYQGSEDRNSATTPPACNNNINHLAYIIVEYEGGGLVGYSSYQGSKDRNSATTPPPGNNNNNHFANIVLRLLASIVRIWIRI